ncbi:MAG TPA: hypothetical protein PK829_07445 [Promineifilum sp.]|nr:hypothetical protein [Promineifilum sp.]HQF70862.1 hypothetical protein [Promineifilum sp.]
MESNDVERRYRSHFNRTYGRRGYTFSRYLPAYRYGAKLLQQPRFANRSWSSIEKDVRRDWESRNAEPWPDFHDAVRYAWEMGQTGTQSSSKTLPTPDFSHQGGPHVNKRRL